MKIGLDGVILWVRKHLISDHMIEVSFLIPINEDKRNGNGQPHSMSKWREFNSRLITGFGGFTKGPTVTGAWLNGTGEEIADESVEYRLAVKECDVPKVRTFLTDASRLFGQECIYFKRGYTAELLYPKAA